MSGFYRRQRTDEAFDLFYDGVVKIALDLTVGAPQLPQYRRAPVRIDDGALPHRFASPRDYYCSLYFQACDLLLREFRGFSRNPGRGVLTRMLSMNGVWSC